MQDSNTVVLREVLERIEKTECSLKDINSSYDKETTADIDSIVQFALRMQKDAILRAVKKLKEIKD